jgi:hypothetical protein
MDKLETIFDQLFKDLEDCKQILEGMREDMASEDVATEAVASEDIESEAASVASQIKDKKPRRVKKPRRACRFL